MLALSLAGALLCLSLFAVAWRRRRRFESKHTPVITGTVSQVSSGHSRVSMAELMEATSHTAATPSPPPTDVAADDGVLSKCEAMPDEVSVEELVVGMPAETSATADMTLEATAAAPMVPTMHRADAKAAAPSSCESSDASRLHSRHQGSVPFRGSSTSASVTQSQRYSTNARGTGIWDGKPVSFTE